MTNGIFSSANSGLTRGNSQRGSPRIVFGKNVTIRNFVCKKIDDAQQDGTVLTDDQKNERIQHTTQKLEQNTSLATKLNDMLPAEEKIDFDKFDNSSKGKEDTNISKNLKKEIENVLEKLAKKEGMSEDEIKELKESCRNGDKYKSSDFINKLCSKLKEKNPEKFKILDDNSSNQETRQTDRNDDGNQSNRSSNNSSNDDDFSIPAYRPNINGGDNDLSTSANRFGSNNNPLNTNLNNQQNLSQQLDNINSQTEQVKMQTEIAKAEQDLKSAIMDRDHAIQSGEIGLMQKQQEIQKSLEQQVSGQARNMAQQATSAANGIGSARQQAMSMMDNKINQQNDRFSQDQNRMQQALRNQQGQGF